MQSLNGHSGGFAASGHTNGHVNGFVPRARRASALDERVLVLNKFYAAVRIISARRAFVLLFKEAAEIIHVDSGQYSNYDLLTWIEMAAMQREVEAHRHDWVRTVRFEIAVPRIVRLLGYDRLPRQTVKLNRKNIFARDRHQCQYCGHSFSTGDLTIDHVIPRTQGGGDTWENLVTACVRCNARKGGRTPIQAHMDLIRPPVRPRRNPSIATRLDAEKYATWKAFIADGAWGIEDKR
jgi:5-methylcytosine-specific restriction endonuclease McrA